MVMDPDRKYRPAECLDTTLRLGYRRVFSRLSGDSLEQEEHVLPFSLPFRGFVCLIVLLALFTACLFVSGERGEFFAICVVATVVVGSAIAVHSFPVFFSFTFPRRISIDHSELKVVEPSRFASYPLRDVYFSDGYAYTLSPPFRRECILLQIPERKETLTVGFTEESAALWRELLAGGYATRLRARHRLEPAVIIGGAVIGCTASWACFICKDWFASTIPLGIWWVAVLGLPLMGVMAGLVLSGNDFFFVQPLAGTLIMILPGTLIGCVSGLDDELEPEGVLFRVFIVGLLGAVIARLFRFVSERAIASQH